MILLIRKSFKKATDKLPAKVADILADKIEILRVDPFDPVLNNHKLQGSMHRYRSIDITGDYRLLYEQYSKDTLYLVNIGRHSQLYGK